MKKLFCVYVVRDGKTVRSVLPIYNPWLYLAFLSRYFSADDVICSRFHIPSSCSLMSVPQFRSEITFRFPIIPRRPFVHWQGSKEGQDSSQVPLVSCNGRQQLYFFFPFSIFLFLLSLPLFSSATLFFILFISRRLSSSFLHPYVRSLLTQCLQPFLLLPVLSYQLG